MKGVVVVGNVTLDVICRTIDDVPRYESISFDSVILSPGGCASNVAVGLAALGVRTYLVCKTGSDLAGEIIRKKWGRFGIDLRYAMIEPNINTAVSIGLVDRDAQPRFIHTPGANAKLSPADIPLEKISEINAGHFHIGGYFVLPGFLDSKLIGVLNHLRSINITTSLDVVNSKRYWKPEYLFPCLKAIDYFMCNKIEAQKLTGTEEFEESARKFRECGAENVIIKLGKDGCYIDGKDYRGIVEAEEVSVVDTTGAGDGFAAGLIAGLNEGRGLYSACKKAVYIGGKIVEELGAITYWEKLVGQGF